MKTHLPTIPEPPSSSLPLAQDDSVMPPAFWRLVRIGEQAGLVTPPDELGLAESEETIVRMRASVAQMLDELRYSATEFYLLVTLFHAAPHSVSLETLARETLAESESLGVALERLHAEQAIVAECEGDLEAPVALTPSGKSLVLLLMYRTFRSGFPGDDHFLTAPETPAETHHPIHSL